MWMGQSGFKVPCERGNTVLHTMHNAHNESQCSIHHRQRVTTINCNCCRHACSSIPQARVGRSFCEMIVCTSTNSRICISMATHLGHTCSYALYYALLPHDRLLLMTTLMGIKVLPALSSPLRPRRLWRFWPLSDGASLKPGKNISQQSNQHIEYGDVIMYYVAMQIFI